MQNDQPITDKNHPTWHDEHELQLTPSQKFAVKFVGAMGTIPFVICFNVFVVVWVTINSYLGFKPLHLGGLSLIAWDAYPFILLNLFFSWQASNAASFILIDANIKNQRAELQAQHDRDTFQATLEEVKIGHQLTEDVKQINANQNEILKEIRQYLNKG